jgi:hypothetical protein
MVTIAVTIYFSITQVVNSFTPRKLQLMMPMRVIFIQLIEEKRVKV